MNVHATQRGHRHYPSMLEDVEAHRPTEIDLINGSLIREADRHGVPVPLHIDALPARESEGGFVANEGLRRRLRRRRLAVRRQPRHARRRRGLGLRPRRATTSTRSTATACGSPAPARCIGTAARDAPTPPSCPPATSASSRPRRCTPTRRSPPRRTPSPTARSRPSRTGSATRRCSRGHVARVIRGTTFPAGKLLEPGVVQWDVKGDTTLGPFEPQPARARRDRAPRRRVHARRHADARAVADARGPQWRKVIFNAATNPLGALTGLTHGRVCERPPLRAPRLAARRRGQGRRGGTGDRARLRSRGADRLRRPARGRLQPQGLDAAGRRGAPADRGRLPERRYRRASGARSACRRRRTRRSGHS